MYRIRFYNVSFSHLYKTRETLSHLYKTRETLSRLYKTRETLFHLHKTRMPCVRPSIMKRVNNKTTGILLMIWCMNMTMIGCVCFRRSNRKTNTEIEVRNTSENKTTRLSVNWHNVYRYNFNWHYVNNKIGYGIVIISLILTMLSNAKLFQLTHALRIFFI
jgi:hypothetical protein